MSVTKHLCIGLLRPKGTAGALSSLDGMGGLKEKPPYSTGHPSAAMACTFRPVRSSRCFELL
jgi:hypothetical protein